MARKLKVDNSILKRLRQKQNREIRKFETKEVRERIIIVCEGKKTEPNYFISLEKELYKGVVELFIFGEGENTIDVVDSAIAKRNSFIENGADVNQTWAVFDRDDFPVVRYNEAVFKAQRSDILLANSNESFELWYLLHFQFLDAAINRAKYIACIEKHLKEKYMKNSSEMFSKLKLKGSQKLAIENAIRLNSKYDGSNPANENPSTNVFKLVESLNRFKEA